MGCSDTGTQNGEGGSGGTATGGSTGLGGTGGAGNGVAGSSVAGSNGVAGSTGVAGSAGAGPAGAPGNGGSVAGGGSGGAAAGSTGAAGAKGGSSGTAGSGGAAPGGSTGTAGAKGGSTGAAGASGGAGGAAPTCPVVVPPTGGTKYCSNSKGSAGGKYTYELWAEGAGQGCMTVYKSDAKFSATWSGVEDFLARIGLDFDQTKTHTQLGTIAADFAEMKTGSKDGLVYVGIYGWTVEPLREYYILDDWGTTMPAGTASDGTPRDHVGTITVDGGTYEVWKKTRVNKPSIIGNQTFDQYFSIRQTARQCGHISISQHFSEWNRLGLPLGKLYEAKLLVEAQDSTGTIDFTTATVTVK